VQGIAGNRKLCHCLWSTLFCWTQKKHFCLYNESKRDPTKTALDPWM